jgi:hypothetical protein
LSRPKLSDSSKPFTFSSKKYAGGCFIYNFLLSRYGQGERKKGEEREKEGGAGMVYASKHNEGY